ncbi:MAG: 50S ribosomal protein L11 methyltransferase [Deltaproteobacteria bacterium]|nr:50S ribosomal protein L11 methyltransferase [Deltaproteobacteria bacterium]
MSYTKIIAKGKEERKDIAAHIIMEAGSSGVEEISKGSNINIIGFIETEQSLNISQIKKELSKVGYSLSVSEYNETGWEHKWKKGIKPVSVGSFFVRPTWSKAKTPSGKKLIMIDPGMAFGTGTHPTTKLCLKAISEVISVKGKTVLDVGTGSGILAIGAFKLKASKVMGTDNDPVALKVARANTRLNKSSISFSGRNLSSLKGGFDVVIANIISGTLKELKKELKGKVKKGGALILSGILNNEVDDLQNSFTDDSFIKEKNLKSGEWSAIVMSRKP